MIKIRGKGIDNPISTFVPGKITKNGNSEIFLTRKQIFAVLATLGLSASRHAFAVLRKIVYFGKNFHTVRDDGYFGIIFIKTIL